MTVYESKVFIKKTGNERRGWAVKMLEGKAFIHSFISHSIDNTQIWN